MEDSDTDIIAASQALASSTELDEYVMIADAYLDIILENHLVILSFINQDFFLILNHTTVSLFYLE